MAPGKTPREISVENPTLSGWEGSVNAIRGRVHNDTAAGEPGARHGACRSKVASSAARHGKRRDGERRVTRSERSERSRQAACYAPGGVRSALPHRL